MLQPDLGSDMGGRLEAGGLVAGWRRGGMDV